MYQRKAKWITPSFDDNFLPLPLPLVSSQSKVSRPTVIDLCKDDEPTMNMELGKTVQGQQFQGNRSGNCSWLEKHVPMTESSLAVHKKKTQEVKQWLLDHQLNPRTKKSGKILLLTGPAGSGKTATIKALCNDLKVEIKEWTNPVTKNQQEPFNPRDESTFHGTSQTKQFSEFLLRANRYSGVVLADDARGPVCHETRRIVLVEDFPNVFYCDASAFHTVLRQYNAKSRSPLVFILSDCFSGENNSRQLFPKNLQCELGVTTISFNAVAPTSMAKALAKIVETEQKQGIIEGIASQRNALDMIVAGCNGDIRAAVNSLEFSFCTEKRTSPDFFSSGAPARKRPGRSTSLAQSSTKLKQPKSSSVASTIVSARDASLFLFRALGKILYCKRDALKSSDRAFPNRPHLDRGKLQFDPEDVMERCHVSPAMLNLYLHENYLEFFTDIDDVVHASEYLSAADVVTGLWSTRSQLEEYSSSIATRGIMFSNRRSHATTSAWRPLHKPHFYDVNRELSDNNHCGVHLLQELRCSGTTLFTELVPFLGKVDLQMRNPAQIAFVQMMSHFRRSNSSARTRSDKLDERDAAGRITDDVLVDSGGASKDNANDAVSDSQPSSQPSLVTSDEEDEENIEQFEDSD